MSSRTEEILIAMINGGDLSALEPPQSRVEALLLQLAQKGGGGSLPIHICASDEYDRLTGVPTVSSPDEGTLYLVPASSATTGNLFDEWAYVNSTWERVGGTTIDVSSLKEEISEYVVDEIMNEVEGSIPTTVTSWLDDHVNPESDVVIDDTLSIQGVAADAAKVGELKSAFQDLSNLDNHNTNVYLNDWTIGRAEAGNNNYLSYCCYSDILPTDGTYIYFDDTKYKVVFSFFETDTQPYADAMGSWVTSSPAKNTNVRSYYKVNVALKSASGNIDTSEVANTTYYIDDETAQIVYAVKNLLTVGYVDSSALSDGNGTKESPFNSIQSALNAGKTEIFAKAGSYSPFVIRNTDKPVKIKLWEMPSFTVAVPEVPKIKIENAPGEYGIQCKNCDIVEISDVWVDTPNRYGFYFTNVRQLKLTRCFANSNVTNGFSLFYFSHINGTIRDCLAWGSTLDGFNIHGYGDTAFINCIAYNNGDDGLSHHDGTTGVVIGGEFYNNGKAGIAPFSGADITIQNVYSHNNAQYGIYAHAGETDNRTKCRISGCAIKNNTTKDIYIGKCDAIAWNNIYDTKSGTFTEITL